VFSVQSDAATVSDYLAEVPAGRLAALTRIRELCCTLLVDFEESMQYGGPCYSRNGEVEVGFASQKHFIGLYILRTDVMKSHLHLLQGKGISLGKGCIRYSRPERIDFAVVESLLKATQATTGKVC
jgi:hypothetical protein